MKVYATIWPSVDKRTFAAKLRCETPRCGDSLGRLQGPSRWSLHRIGHKLKPREIGEGAILVGSREDLQMSAITPFQRELKRLTQMSYLLASGASLVTESSSTEMSNRLQARIAILCSDGQPLKRVAFSAEDVAKRRVELPSFLADLLLVHLNTLLHSTLAQYAGVLAEEQAPSLETLVMKLSQLDKVPRAEWWFRDIILLSEIRHRVVHGDGKVFLPCQRLLAAGWENTMLSSETCMTQRSFSDFLRFKRSVRTAANNLLSGD